MSNDIMLMEGQAATKRLAQYGRVYEDIWRNSLRRTPPTGFCLVGIRRAEPCFVVASVLQAYLRNIGLTDLASSWAMARVSEVDQTLGVNDWR